jgi:nucleoside-diphosphate-sugar epimerase
VLSPDRFDKAGSMVMGPSSRISVAGHRGLVGSALVRHLLAGGCNRIITRSHDELDLEEHAEVEEFFERERPDYVFRSAEGHTRIREFAKAPQ